jgi:hypothetical protein
VRPSRQASLRTTAAAAGLGAAALLYATSRKGRADHVKTHGVMGTHPRDAAGPVGQGSRSDWVGADYCRKVEDVWRHASGGRLD